MKTNTKSEIFSWIKVIGFALIAVFVLREFVLVPVDVNGESMEPTFENADRLVISKVSEIDRFDSIVFEEPIKNDQYIKRVIGLPGDEVEMKNGMLYINGKLYEEPYLTESNNKFGDFTLKELTGEEKVPSDHMFVLGDNRMNSEDSRVFGFISTDAIIGEAMFRYYPIQKMGILD